MSATDQPTWHWGLLYYSVVNSVYCCCVLLVKCVLFTRRESCSLPHLSVPRSSPTSANLSLHRDTWERQKFSTWQTVNKGDSGRAGGEKAAGVKLCWLETRGHKASLYCRFINTYYDMVSHTGITMIPFSLQLSKQNMCEHVSHFLRSRPCFPRVPTPMKLRHKSLSRGSSSHLVSRARGVRPPLFTFHLQHLASYGRHLRTVWCRVFFY